MEQKSTEITNFFVSDGVQMVERPIAMSDAIALYSNNSSNTYPPVFYKNTMKCREWQIAIGQCIGRILDIKSVVDFGCGLGYYLEGFQKSGAVTRGFEISYDNAKEYMSKEVVDNISKGNAMEKIDCGKFDLSMSIEVAEHILPEKSQVLIQNLTDSSNHYILFTAAPPGQGGVCHINERDRIFWIGLLKERGFEFSQKSVDTIRIELNKIPYHGKYFSLIKKQIMIFRREK
jgi:hypothetical protein